MTALDTITRQAKTHGDHVSALHTVVGELESCLADLKRQYHPAIVKAARTARESKARLSASIEQNPDLFGKPRTQEVNGIRFGLQKGKGAIVITSEANSIRRIRKNMPDQAEILIQSKESVVKKALNNLSTAQLKALGITITAASDTIVIKSTDSEVNKLIDAILADAQPAEV